MNTMRIGLTYNLKSEVRVLDPKLLRAEDMFEEFDSPETINALSQVIAELGHEPVKLGFGQPAIEKLLDDNIDFVFNIAEGYFGRSRESHMPALLEMLEIPYSGPDPLTAALTLDKIMAKRIASASNIATPASVVVWPGDEEGPHYMPEYPLILKLAYEGSSIGVRDFSKVNNAKEMSGMMDWLKEYYPEQPVIIEKFISGREFTVGVIGNEKPEVLGIMEIMPKAGQIGDFVYSLEVKRDYLNRVSYQCPAEVNEFLKRRLAKAALRLFYAFGCRDISRFDFRIDDLGMPYFLEVNTLPGLHPVSSDIVIMCRLQGISYRQLVERILSHALRRCNPVHAQV